jgi:DnaJ-class molecular chaperone
MDEIKDYYKILDIDYNSSLLEIKTAFRNAALIWHPDKNNSVYAKEKFIEVYEAYKILINPEKKSLYDEILFEHLSNENELNENKQDVFSKYKKINYRKLEDWINEIRNMAREKANKPFIDDLLTESFHFLDKYSVIIIVLLLTVVLLAVIIIS